jgi:hypothetical protein
VLWWSHTGISCLAECILWWVMRGHIASWRMRRTQTVWTASSGLTMGCVLSLAARMGLRTSGILSGSVGPQCSCLWAQSCLGKWFGIRWHRLLLKLWLSVHFQTRNCSSWYTRSVVKIGWLSDLASHVSHYFHGVFTQSFGQPCVTLVQ